MVVYGGEQSFPFILHPSEWELGDDLIGAENVNQSFKSEIMNLNSEGF
ncbi:MAG: hypothetical protein ACP5OJ_04370 [Methanothermobacter sp.]|jgi:hypothetical protein